MGLYHPIIIENVEIPGNIFLAPLAGFTDRAFREICLEWGADFTFTEMVSCEGIIRGNAKTKALLPPAERERLFAIQLFTSHPESAAAAAVIASSYGPSLIDLNCGCPVPKVVKAGAGSALTRDPARVAEIVSAMKKALREREVPIPITVKLRSGWNNDEITFKETALAATDAGAALVTLHPRTKTQGYGGTAEWEYIAELKAALPDIPVIGSGDLFAPEDVKRMLEQTGCDGVMIARGAVGNPFIFTETKDLLERGTSHPAITREARIKTALDHLARSESYKGKYTGFKDMKKHLCSYTKGMPGGAELRNKIVHAENGEAVATLLTHYRARSGR